MTEKPSKRRYLSLWLPFLAADRWRRDKPAEMAAGEAPPLVFIEKIKGASRILAADARAIAAGLQPGMALADARARIPALVAIALDRGSDAAYLAHLADVCLAFTPSVAPEKPDGLTLDITGCAHLFAGEAGLIKRLRMALRKSAVSSAQIAIAPTPDMARALARYGKRHPTIAHDAHEVRALPVAALEASAEDALALRRAGLRVIADIADRPSVLFSARFTQAFTTKLARILGEEDRRIAPLVAPPSYLFDQRCAEPVVSAEVIERILGELAQRAALKLQKHGEGGRIFETVLFRTDGCVRRIRVETSEAARDPAVVLRLHRDRLEALNDPLDPGFGFDLIRFHVVRTEPFDARQSSLDAHDERQEQFVALIDRLGAIFGAQRVVRHLPADTHIPERAQVVLPASNACKTVPWSEPEPGVAPLRPLHLFESPHLIEMHNPIEMHGGAADAKAARFRWRRGMHEIARSEGPERIAEAWWEPPSAYGTRDYYRIETSQGRRFWIFRARAARGADPDRWFLHGVFA